MAVIRAHRPGHATANPRTAGRWSVVQRVPVFTCAPRETFFDRNTGRYQVRSGTANEKSTEGTLRSRAC